MTVKRNIFVSAIIFFSLLFLGFAALSCLFLFFPRYLESSVIPSIAKENGIDISSLRVRCIGLKGADISDIKIGGNGDENLAIDSVRIDYSIPGLLGKRLERIEISGISVTAKYENNAFAIGALDSVFNNRKREAVNKNESGRGLTVKSLVVTDSVINLKINGSDFRLPVEMSAAALDSNYIPGQFTLRAYPGENSVTVEGKKGNSGRINLDVTSEKMSLAFLGDFLNGMIPVNMKGRTDIELAANLSFEPFSITEISSSFMFRGTVIDYAGVILKNPLSPDKNELPVEININSADARHWGYETSAILLDYDSLLVESDLSGTADVGEGTLKGKIKAMTRLMTVDDSPPFYWDISADRDNNSGPVKVQINGKSEEQNKPVHFKAVFNDINVDILSPEIASGLEYNKGVLSGSYDISLENISAVIEKMSFSAPSVSVKGSIKQAGKNMSEYISSFSAGSSKIAFTGFDVNAGIPDYRIKGTVKYDAEQGLITDALLDFKKGALSMRDGSLKVRGISGKIPVTWPYKNTSDEGSLHIEDVKFRTYSLGPIDMKIPRKGSTVSLKGRARYPVFPGMTINLSGSTSLDSAFNRAEMNVEIPEYRSDSDIDMGKFLPELEGFDFNGIVKSHGNIKLSDRLLSSGLNLEIKKGRVSNSEKNLTSENISLKVTLEDLVSPRSPFGQELRTGKITFGDIEVSDFLVNFRVDSLSSLFIEQGKFNWCGGTINVQSFRVDTEKEKYLLTLFCDRLRLADLLEQFGVSGVSGGGTVNGKIPLIISKGKIGFEDGFLYSTPGGGGKINITGTDVFKQGITPGSPEYTQMDIASEALKAFDYSWVKMDINSEQDELAVKLQFDGKPENKLPFRYDKDLNQFKRVGKDVVGSDFQGIRLDVNLRLPLDELLNYKSALDMINF